MSYALVREAAGSSSVSKSGSAEFKQAVRSFLERNLSSFAGWYEVSVDDEKIRASWKTAPNEPDVLSGIVALLAKREYGVGIQLLRMLLPSRENDPAIHYNLGMALSDIGELQDAETHIRRVLELAPEFTNARVAHGVALARQRKWTQEIEDLKIAVEQDPDNGYAWRNLGACLVSERRVAEAEECFRRAVQCLPNDQAARLGLAQALDAQGQSDEADGVYRKAVELDPFSNLAEIARRARTKIAEATFKRTAIDGVRSNAVLYCHAAMETFSQLLPDQVQACGFEIAALGTKGINPNNPERIYTLRTLPGKFTGLQLLAYMYVPLKQTAPHLDIEFDLSAEYREALRFFGKPKD